MSTPRGKYYTKMHENLVDSNDRNDAPFSNDNIRQEIHKVIAEEEVEDHKVTMDNLIQTPVTPNIQGDNENTILTREKQNS